MGNILKKGVYTIRVIQDGRPQGVCHANKKRLCFVVGEDGRPQGAQPRATPPPSLLYTNDGSIVV